MRLIFLLFIIFLSSCENKKEAITNRQQAIKEEIEQVKALYYKKVDSLDSARRSDTSSAKDLIILQELRSADEKNSVTLIKLQREYDSLELALKK